jgi:hypothetical protein
VENLNHPSDFLVKKRNGVVIVNQKMRSTSCQKNAPVEIIEFTVFRVIHDQRGVNHVNQVMQSISSVLYAPDTTEFHVPSELVSHTGKHFVSHVTQMIRDAYLAKKTNTRSFASSKSMVLMSPKENIESITNV